MRISVAIPGAKSPRPTPMSTATSDFLVCGVVCARLVVAPTLAVVRTARSDQIQVKFSLSKSLTNALVAFIRVPSHFTHNFYISDDIVYGSVVNNRCEPNEQHAKSLN